MEVSVNRNTRNMNTNFKYRGENNTRFRDGMKVQIGFSIIGCSVLMFMAQPLEAQIVLSNTNCSVSVYGTTNSSLVYTQFQAGLGLSVSGSSGAGVNPGLSSSAMQDCSVSTSSIYAQNQLHCGYSYSGPGPYGDAYAVNTFQISFILQTPVLFNVTASESGSGDIYEQNLPTLTLSGPGIYVSTSGFQPTAYFSGMLQPGTYQMNLDMSLAFGAYYDPPYTSDQAGILTTWNVTATIIPPPTIITNPVSVTASPGDTATFNVVASGNSNAGSLNYQWLFNGTNAIVGATNATITLTNLTMSQVGAYSVVVSNLAGASASSAAELSLLSLNMYAGLMIAGEVGATYQIDYRNNVAGSNWTTLTNLVLPSNPFLFIDSNSPYYSQRFYRAVLQ
jgi:hypothetical protein